MALVLLGALFIYACSDDLYGRLPDPDEWTEPKTPPRLPDAGAFAPKVLNDTTKIRAYVEEFPRDAYVIASISGLGRFYIDTDEDVIKGRLAKGEPWEKTVTKRILDQIQPHSVALDVGAHIGTHSILMGQAVGPWGRVYAFEPQRKLFRELVQNLRLNGLDNVVPLRYALGTGPARIIEMNVATESNEGGTAVGTGGDPAELRSLDDFRFEDVSLIKIDVEGFEMEVLRGALETISRSRPVLIIEIHGANGTADQQARYRATQDYVRGLGYRPVLIRHADWLFLPEG
ncbi:MAG: FkbM family methyltransferase [Planctomycetes bacterium]|nr:FkbM family methyltransferase [Planctomycetota bacterium]